MAPINIKKHQKLDQFVKSLGVYSESVNSYISRHCKANFGVLEIFHSSSKYENSVIIATHFNT